LLPGVESFYRLFGGRPRLLIRPQRSRSFLLSGLRALQQFRHERSFGMAVR